MLSHITNTTGKRINFEYFAHPDLENTTRTDKENMLKNFGMYYEYDRKYTTHKIADHQRIRLNFHILQIFSNTQQIFFERSSVN
jgi:hypothetical protein